MQESTTPKVHSLQWSTFASLIIAGSRLSAGVRLEVHGTEGSLFAVDVMTQDPVGRVVLRRDKEETEIKLDRPEDLYVHSIRHFNQAVLTGTQPFATGVDGLRSLAVALAAMESTKSGRRTPVRQQGTPEGVH